MDYGPSLPPHLRDDQSRHDPDTSDQYSGQSDEPSQVTSARPQKHADKRHDTDPRHASDQHSALSDEPTQVTSARPKNMQIKENTKLGLDMCLHLQRRIQPQHDPDPPFIGKCPWLTFPLNMLKKWTPLGVFLTFLIPGKPCLGLLLLS